MRINMTEEKKLKWKRYIIRVHKTFYLSLPREYIEGMKLNKDDEIDIILNADGSLTLVPKENMPAESPLNYQDPARYHICLNL